MVDSSLITDEESTYNNLSDLSTSDNEETTTADYQEDSYSTSVSARISSTLSSQYIYRSHQTNIESYDDIPFESSIEPDQSDFVNHDNFSSDINIANQRTISSNSDIFSTTKTILAQALPETLAAPPGWYSELFDSFLTISLEMESNLNINNNNNNNINFIEENEDYQTLNMMDAPPMIFSSTDEYNRRINEISSSTIFPSTAFNTNSISEMSNITFDDCISNEETINLMKDQEISSSNIEDIESSTPPPIVIRKKMPNNNVTYQQNITVRYLQPPTPPPHGPIIIREICPSSSIPEPPLQIRQRPPPPVTPPPLIIRERPPTPPPRLSPQVIEKLLPPPPRPPRRMIVERFASCPPKPADVIIERWLPYKRSDRRQVLYQRAPQHNIRPKEPNILIIHEQPHARIQQEFINEGVTRVDPQVYLQRYGSELDSWQKNSHLTNLVSQATHVLPPPKPTFSTIDPHSHLQSPTSYAHGYQSPPSTGATNIPTKMKSATSTPYSKSYSDDYAQFDSSYHYSPQSFNRVQEENVNKMVNGTHSWDDHSYPPSSRSHLPSYQFPSTSSPIPSKTIQVNSETELQHILSDLTHGQVSSSLGSY
ncbi:unnamed protein product [Rotaria sordida]|uniref:Uncharacterized protein n=1 Tax=Rotaria sordida TaxID=392033 RepID=A0A819NGL6_9BILA|nr:unnamed protein product [Rotaria sordida]